ncbi:hypothetical protein [Acetonema longum]|uniref:Uncharacterized protein n=1 Tax=Acetonema longum DSM 6540 TaxID=1009370 RepID=F7NKA4_9FIRM|nr:hypothetical protein [Acetonema longum]EGO63545.1 hypothetical protein ALO_12586 [Acetonema longum DSM 6540]
MCDCQNRVCTELKKAFPTARRVIMPVELLSNRIYIEATADVIGENGKLKDKKIKVMVSYCPFCGEKYPEKGEESV